MNLPNKITLIRIFLIPVMIFFYLATFVPYGKIIALVVLIAAAFTDMLDGHIARKYNMVTDMGKFLDPVADKLLTASALLLVVVDGVIPSPYGVIAAIIIIGRELIISAFRQVAAAKNFIMAADKWGKIKTIFQDISLPLLFLLAFHYETGLPINSTGEFVFEIINYVFLGIATLLTIVSGCNYIVKNWKVVK